MPQLVTLKPKPGARVVDPVTRTALPASGATVPLSPYWRRRITDGDVEVVAAIAEPAADTEPEKAPRKAKG